MNRLLILVFIPLFSFGQSAKDYFEQANDSLANRNPFSAIDLYSIAIDIDLTYADAYLNRGIAKALIDPKIFGSIYEDKTSACSDLYKARKIGRVDSEAAKHAQNLIDVICKNLTQKDTDRLKTHADDIYNVLKKNLNINN